MKFPSLIEIRRPASTVKVRVSVPGSKSITNRCLILAALADGPVRLEGCLWSEDTYILVSALRRLGFKLEIEPDPIELCNRTITVHGLGGLVPPGGSSSNPLELYVGNAGTAARFLAAFVALGSGWYKLFGDKRMNERPQSGLFEALRQLGCQVLAEQDRLPALICAVGPREGRCVVDVRESSQFGSALLLVASRAPWNIQFADPNVLEHGYLRLTRELLKVFPKGPGLFRVEPDASSGSYFWAADWILKQKDLTGKSQVIVTNWPTSGWQIDERFPSYLPPKGVISREKDLGDSILTAMILAAIGQEPVLFTDLAKLRLQECDRVEAMRTELTRCGAAVEVEDDRLLVRPSKSLIPAEVETYKDHRIAMCFSILGLAVDGMRIRNPACVAKTFPNFYQKLACQPPNGLGVQIIDVLTGKPCPPESLVMRFDY